MISESKPTNKVNPPPECFEGEGADLSFYKTNPVLSIEEPTEKQRNTALCFPGLGVARMIFPFAFLQRHWQLIAYQLAPCTGTYIMHACTHMTNTYLCFLSPPLIKSHMHTTKSPTFTDACVEHTGFFFVSHSCVQISNRARWERTNTLTRKD